MSKVSILIPAYNVGEFIGRCLDSAVNQTLKDIEIIVVNDGSTDDTSKIIKSFAVKDSRIIVISQENAGLSMARNVAIKKAKSKYILHLDGDDWLELNACELLYIASENNDADIVVYDSFNNHENGIEDIFHEKSASDNNTDFIRQILKYEIKPCVIRKLFKRSLYIQNDICHPRDVSLGEDLATIVPLAFYSKKIISFNKCLYHYYQRGNSITKKYSPQMFDIFKSVDYICEFLDKKDISKYFENEIIFLKFFHIFLHRIVLYKTNSPLQKELWKKWKDLKIQFLKNDLCREWLKNRTFYLKLRILAYQYSYFIGRIISVFQKF